MRTDKAEQSIALKSGELITDSGLQRGLLILNRTPGIQVKGVLIPGATPGTSTLYTSVADTPVLRGSFGLDNYGSPYTGRGRALANLALDNPTGGGDSIAINAIGTEGDLLHSGGFNYLSTDLYQGLRANLYGSQVRYKLGKEFSSLKLKGRADQYGFGLNYPFILRAGKLLEGRVDLTRNTFKQDPGTRYNLDTARFAFIGVLADIYGNTSGGISVTKGKHDNKTATYLSRDFWVSQFQLQRMHYLPSQFYIKALVSGQFASTSLDASQQFYLGGPHGIIAYDTGTLGGDQAVLLNLGLYKELSSAIPGNLVVGVALLNGKIRQKSHKVLSGTRRKDSASSAGMVVEYRFNRHVYAHISYAHRIGNRPDSIEKRRDDRFWASVSLDF